MKDSPTLAISARVSRARDPEAPYTLTRGPGHSLVLWTILSAPHKAQHGRTPLRPKLALSLCMLWPVAPRPARDTKRSLLMSAQLRPAPDTSNTTVSAGPPTRHGKPGTQRAASCPVPPGVPVLLQHKPHLLTSGSAGPPLLTPTKSTQHISLKRGPNATLLPSGTQAKLNIPHNPESQPPKQLPILPPCLCKAGPQCRAARQWPSPPVPGTIKAQPTGQLKAERFLQVGTAILVDDLPEMQAAIIQQGQEAALVGEQRPGLGWWDGEGECGSFE